MRVNNILRRDVIRASYDLSKIFNNINLKITYIKLLNYCYLKLIWNKIYRLTRLSMINNKTATTLDYINPVNNQ